MFEKEDIKKWRRFLHREFRWVKLPSEDPTYRAAMVLATVYAFGTDVGILAQLTGQTEDFVKATLKRARAVRLLTGQRLRVGWNDKKYGMWALFLDAMVAEGTLSRPPDKKRSALAKARPRGPDKKPRAKRVSVAAGSVFSPKVTNSEPMYGLAEWDKKKAAT